MVDKKPDEQKENETAKAGVPVEDSKDGNEPKELSVIERTNAAAERVEKANAEAERLLKERQELYAQEKLGGRSGTAVVIEKAKEETNTEYAKRVMAGDIKDNEGKR